MIPTIAKLKTANAEYDVALETHYRALEDVPYVVAKNTDAELRRARIVRGQIKRHTGSFEEKMNLIAKEKAHCARHLELIRQRYELEDKLTKELEDAFEKRWLTPRE